MTGNTDSAGQEGMPLLLEAEPSELENLYGRGRFVSSIPRDGWPVKTAAGAEDNTSAFLSLGNTRELLYSIQSLEHVGTVRFSQFHGFNSN